MSYFKAKMHQMQFWLGLRVGGAYSAPPEPLSGFKGACTSKARDGRKNGREGQGRGRGGEAEEGKEEFCAVVTFPLLGKTLE